MTGAALMTSDAPSEGSPRVQPGMARARVHACLDCGNDMPSSHAAFEFCGPRCRDRWNNRRRLRGAELYDLYMAHRFERRLSAVLGLFQAINRLAAIWREEDRMRRDGRRSWRKAEDVLGDKPHLKAIRMRGRDRA